MKGRSAVRVLTLSDQRPWAEAPSPLREPRACHLFQEDPATGASASARVVMSNARIPTGCDDEDRSVKYMRLPSGETATNSYGESPRSSMLDAAPLSVLTTA